MSGMSGLLSHGAGVGEAGAAVAWLVANLMAVSRRPQSASRWYALAGLVEGALAILWGTTEGVAAWWALGIVWAVAKGLVVPRWIERAFPPDRFEMAVPGTPRLLVGSAVLMVVAVLAAGAAGVALAAVLTPFWLLAQRRELWAGSVLLIEAEVAVGFLALTLGAAPQLADLLDVAELVWAAGLIAWFQRRAREDIAEPIHTTALRRLRG
jgi:hypothetical protein